MAIVLPPLPRGTSIAPRLLRFGGDLTPWLGGPLTRIARLGSRFAFDVDMPKMTPSCASRLIAARLAADATGDVLRLPIPQNGDGAAAGLKNATGGAINSAMVSTSGAAGVSVGMFFSFEASGRRYLHMVTSVAGSQLGVAPLLRASPAGQVLDFAAPVVEGVVDETAWTMDRMVAIGQRFSLSEAR